MKLAVTVFSFQINVTLKQVEHGARSKQKLFSSAESTFSKMTIVV